MPMSKQERNAKERARRAAKKAEAAKTAEVEAAENTIAQAMEADVTETKKEVAEVVAEVARPKRFPKPANNDDYFALMDAGRYEAERSVDGNLSAQERLDAAIRARHAWQLCINHAAFEIRDPLREQVNS